MVDGSATGGGRVQSDNGVRGERGDKVTDLTAGESRMKASGVLGGVERGTAISPSGVNSGRGGEKGHLVDSDDAEDTGSFRRQEG